jgi:phenylacetate-CoA ligase
MAKVTGRTDDLIILRGVNVFPTQIEEIVLRTPALSPHFQLVRSTRGRLDHLTVRVEARHDASGDDRSRAASELVTGVKDGVGVTVSVDVVDPDTLERSMGKMRRIVDQREKP